MFLVTNEDSTYPAGGGLLPGAGAISAPLRYALGKDPVSIGKPASTMLDCIKAKYVRNMQRTLHFVLIYFPRCARVNFDPKRTLMIGDRLNTDILFGQNGGLSTLLVLTGANRKSCG